MNLALQQDKATIVPAVLHGLYLSVANSAVMTLQAAAEGEMLTEVQWRVAALEALHAFVLGPCTRCGPLQSATLMATCASLLQPTLDAVCAAPALQVLFHCTCICQVLLLHFSHAFSNE